MTHSESFDRPVPNACGTPRFFAIGALVFSTFVLTNSAHATGGSASVPDPTAAALFQDGRDLVDRGEWKEGCTKFEASMALYPAASTLLNIARCYEHDGKLAVAWSAYQRALVINRETQGEERKKALDDVAKKGLADIEPRLPRLKIVLSGSPPSGLRVMQNGKDVPLALLGTVIPVDPGAQSVFAEAPGYEPSTQSVTVAERELVEIQIALEKRTGEPTYVTQEVPKWAWISGGVGIGLLAGAAAFRIDQAFVEGRQSGLCKGDVEAKCPPKSEYDPAADNDRKNLDNKLFIGLGVAGLVGVGAAVFGIVMPRSMKKKSNAPTAMVTPWIAPTSVGVGIGGRF